MKKRGISFSAVLLLILVIISGLFGGEKGESTAADAAAVRKGQTAVSEKEDTDGAGVQVEEDGVYTSKEEVAAYIHEFGRLPSNYITKNEARKLGWDSSEGSLWEVTDQKSIGGDRFGNYDGQLPEKKGRTYRECDIDYDGGFRNGKRIIYSDDGLIYYTEDHYKTFEKVY